MASVAAASILAWACRLDVATIASSFGSLPHGLPMPTLPQVTLPLLVDILPAAIAFTLQAGSRAICRPRSQTA